MNAIYTVLRKELIELFGDRESLRGPLLQGVILILLVGVIVPALDASIWTGTAASVILFQLFPAAIASMIAADGFAGERERRTLETLLATPLPESAMFIGKTLSAVVCAVLCSMLSLLSALVVANIRFGPTFVSPTILATVLGGSVAASLFTSAVAVVISSRVEVARSAQQISSMAALLLIVGCATLLERGGTVGAATLLRADLAVAAVAFALLAVSAGAFRRERLFDH
jgi:ABC-2 type transport system permease protein